MAQHKWNRDALDRDMRNKITIAAKAIIVAQTTPMKTQELSSLLWRQFPDVELGRIIQGLQKLAKTELAEWHERGAAVIIKRFGREQRRRPYIWRKPVALPPAQQNCAPELTSREWQIVVAALDWYDGSVATYEEIATLRKKIIKD